MGRIDWLYNPDNKTPGKPINPTPGCSMTECALGKDCYAFIGSPRQIHRCVECGVFRPHFHPERFEAMAKRKIPTGYFFSTGEFFDKEFTDTEIQDRLNWLGKNCSQHRIYILTKQAQRIPDFNYPPNIWLGVSVNLEKDIWRIGHLRMTNAKIKFVSFEPLYANLAPNVGSRLKGIDWIIIGGKTRYGKITFKPDFNWVWGIVDEARKYCTAVFMKDNLEYDKPLQELPK